MFSKSTHEKTYIFQPFPKLLLFSKPQLLHVLYLIQISSNLQDKFYRAWYFIRMWQRLALFWSFEGVQSKVDLVLIEQNLSRNFPRFILKEGFTFKSSFLMKRMEWWQKCYFSRNHQSIVESTEIWQFHFYWYLDSNLNQHWSSKNLRSMIQWFFSTLRLDNKSIVIKSHRPYRRIELCRTDVKRETNLAWKLITCTVQLTSNLNTWHLNKIPIENWRSEELMDSLRWLSSFIL